MYVEFFNEIGEQTMSRIQYKYSVVDRDTGKTINIHNNREDARSDKRDWKAEGFNVAIVQSKYVFIVSKEVR